MLQDLPESTDASQPRLTVVVPAYNEEARIDSSLVRMVEYFDAQPYTYEILVIDDGSTDRTQEVVKARAADHPTLRTLSYDGNHGKGYAVRYGMLHATGDFVLFSDADLATPIDELEKLFKALNTGADVAIGSRDIAGANLEKRQSFLRELGGKTFNRCVQFIAVPGIHDTQCGFKLFTKTAAREVFGRCLIDNFSFDVEALYIARKLGYTVTEVGVRWRHIEGSKVRFVRDAIRMLKTLFRIRATNYQIQPITVKNPSTL